MLRFAKTFGFLVLLVFGVRSASGFALVGPKEAWQVENIGYTMLSEIDYPSGPWNNLRPEWTYAPKNYNEWYRLGVPVLYYTYDPLFSTYFGTNGIGAVDSAFAVLNALPNVDTLSPNLDEFPQDEIRVNYTANSLHLFDLKSSTLEMMMPQMGLADPEYFTWCIRARVPIPGLPCPFFDYNVIQRNFDPITIAPSKFVNGNLYTYQFSIFCPPAFDRQNPEEFLVDPDDTYRTAVASPKITIPNILYYGYFHSSLTRDDVGGLRYLYTTNRVAQEFAPLDSTLFQTNFTPTLLTSSNLTLLAAQALTNDAPTLQALFPGLVVLSSSPFFTNLTFTNFSAYFTNFPWDPVGTPAHVAFITNVTTTVATWFNHTFANLTLISNTPFGTFVPIPLTRIPAPNGRSWVTIQTVTQAFSNAPWAPVGTLVLTTNIGSATFLTNSVVGEYIIFPTNLCAIDLLYSQLTITNAITNQVFTLINTNTTTTNAGTIVSVTENAVTYSTNHVFVIHPVTCTNGSVALRQGLEKISFVRHDYDGLLSRFFYPVTNNYTMMALVSNVWVKQQFQRVVTRPDILINAADLNDIPNVLTVDRFGNNPNFSNAVPNTVGPGVIQGPVTLTFNQVGPIHLNSGPFFVDEATSFNYFTWGSFDGSTNTPVVYGGTSVNELSQQLAINVVPNFLPAGRQNAYATYSLSVSGGLAPYTWGLGPDSNPLPPGLGFGQVPGDSTQATLFGAPSAPGTYVFYFRVTDAAGRFVDANYIFTVNP